MRWRDASIVLSFLALAGCMQPTHAPAPVGGMVMTTTIVISNSGATNLIGYRIMIGQDGSASFASGEGTGNGMLPSDLHDRLTRDLAAVRPLANLPTGTCMKSASFGTSTTIAVGGDRSPDLSCASGAAAQALMSDVTAIADSLHVHNVPRSQGHELPPQNF